MMEQQKKRKFSAVDVVIILIALLSAGIWFLLRPAQPELHTITYYIELRNVYTDEQAYAPQVGDQLFDGNEFRAIGRIVDIDMRPLEAIQPNFVEQRFELYHVPGRYAPLLRVEVDVEYTNAAITTEFGQILRGGSSIDIVGPGYSFGGAIIFHIDRGGLPQ